MNQKKPATILLYFITILTMVALACGGATETVREASDGDTEAEVSEADTSEEEEQPVEEVADDEVEAENQATATPAPPTATATPANTATPTAPPPTPTPDPEELQVLSQGFGQNDRNLGFAFLLENPNEGLALEDTQYQVTAYDEAGAILETSSGNINIVLPGETTGVGDTMFLDEGVTVDSLEVRLSGGTAVASEQLPNFTVDMIRYYTERFSPRVTAVVHSPFNRDFQDVRVSAVLYDETDQIIGGGFTYLEFVPAEGTAGLSMTVNGTDDVARVELYPVLSTLSLVSERELPEGASAPSLLQSGYGQDGTNVGYGFVVENPNTDHAIEALRYQVAAYAADGSVVGVDSGYAPPLLSGQTLGVGGDIFLAVDQPVDHVKAQISGGRFVDADPELQQFTAEEATYSPGSFSAQVTGFVINPYEQDVTDLHVSALVYDEAGEIVGGGFTFMDFASAQDRTPVEVSVVATGVPASAELFPTVSNLSDFQ